MRGLPLIAIGLFFCAVGAARYFVAKPRPDTESTAFDRGDLIASRLMLGAGVVLSVVGIATALVS